MISHFKKPSDTELAEIENILTNEQPIQYDAIPQISLPYGANHGLAADYGMGPKTRVASSLLSSQN